MILLTVLFYVGEAFYDNNELNILVSVEMGRKDGENITSIFCGILPTNAGRGSVRGDIHKTLLHPPRILLKIHILK